MFKILVVDDDFTTRTNLRTILSWEHYGCEICGEAENGQAALEFLADNDVDLIITDMSMPVLNGVGLIQQVRQQWPSIQLIALSSYADFDYVKESMKFGALDYLLKHQLTTAGLVSVLQSALSRLQAEQQRQHQSAKSKHILRREFVRDLIWGRIREEKVIQRQVQELSLPLQGHEFVEVIAAIDDFLVMKARLTPPEEARLIASAEDLMEDILRDMKQGAMTHVSPGKFIFLFSLTGQCSERSSAQRLQAVLTRIMSGMRRYLNLTVSCIVSCSFQGLLQAHEVYRENDNCLRDHMLTDAGKIFWSGRQQKDTKSIFVSLEVKEEKEFIRLLRQGNEAALDRYLQEIFQRLNHSQAGYKSVQMVCAELIGILARQAKECGITVMELCNSKDIPYEEMRQYETLDEVRRWLLEVCQRFLARKMKTEIKAGCSNVTREVMLYVRQHFAQDISLSQAAESVGVNSSYLSRVFKEECGMGFKEYLNSMRIEQAKYLMQNTELCLKELVQQSGFNNYTYFFKVFKLLEGQTPVEYKERYRQTQAIEG